MKRPIYKVREWSSDPRSIGLIVMGLLYIRVMIIYLPWVEDLRNFPLPRPLDTLHLPPWVYGSCWAISGIMTIYAGLAQVAVRRQTRWIFALSIAMPILWATFYAISWVISELRNLEWATAMLYLAIAIVVVCFIEIPPARLYRTQNR